MNISKVKNTLIFLISSVTLYFLNIIPLNYIWGTFNSYFKLISGVGFSIWVLNPLSYMPFIFYWIVTGTAFFKIPSLITLFFLTLHKKRRILGIFFYCLLMIIMLGYFYCLYGIYTTCLYCCGWVLGMVALYFDHIVFTLFSSLWLGHAIGTVLHNYLTPQSTSFYHILAPIAFCERIILWSLAVGLYYALYLLFQSSLTNIISKKCAFFYNKITMKGLK